MATLSRRRRLAIESLEMRHLMASDLAPTHNFRFPEDSNGSGSVTPVDLLVVINQLNQDRGAATRMEPQPFATDINADSNLSPIDALLVLNYLNRPNLSNTIQPSALSIESRVRFLEQWMERGSTDEVNKQSAIETLHVLRLGGRPEWGDRWIDGRLQQPESNPELPDAGAANPAFPPRIPDGSDDLIQLDPIESHPQIYPWMQRLADAGVTSELLQKLKEQWVADWEAGNDWTIDTLRQKLTEAGVDLDAILERHPKVPPGNPDGSDDPIQLDPIESHPHIYPWMQRLADAGVSTELLQKLKEQWVADWEAGNDWTIDTLRQKLTEAGVDLAALFRAAIPHSPLPWLPPSFAPIPNPAISPGLIKLVRDIEIPRAIILSLVEEAKVAADSGKPWDALTWKNRLEAEGLEIGAIAALLPRLLSSSNHRNGIEIVAVV